MDAIRAGETSSQTIDSAGFFVFQEADLMCVARHFWLVASIAVLFGVFSGATLVAEGGPGAEQLAAASDAEQYAYLMFFRTDDDATQAMRSTIEAQVEQSGGKTAIVPVNIGDAADAQLVAKFDATRAPMPLVMGIAPNGAVTGVYPLKVEAVQLQRAVLTPKYSEMVKALQEQKIVVLCMQPANGGVTPQGISEFEALPHFKGRTHRITVQADDDAETHFFERMKLPSDLSATTVMAFAPPGVYVGKWDANVKGVTIGQQVHASGRCNCSECQKHRN